MCEPGYIVLTEPTEHETCDCELLEQLPKNHSVQRFKAIVSVAEMRGLLLIEAATKTDGCGVCWAFQQGICREIPRPIPKQCEPVTRKRGRLVVQL